MKKKQTIEEQQLLVDKDQNSIMSSRFSASTSNNHHQQDHNLRRFSRSLDLDDAAVASTNLNEQPQQYDRKPKGKSRVTETRQTTENDDRQKITYILQDSGGYGASSEDSIE